MFKPTSFPFSRLPIEIQTLILEHTDLILPYPIDCHPKFGLRMIEKPWHLPKCMFPMSKTFNRLASDIFFSNNYWLFELDQNIWDPDFVQRFLARLPAKGLRLIRYLIFAATHTASENIIDESSTIDWPGIVSFIREHMTAARLTILIDSSEDSCYDIESKQKYELFRDKHLLKHEYITSCFEKLSDLKGFDVCLGTILIWNADRTKEGIERDLRRRVLRRNSEREDKETCRHLKIMDLRWYAIIAGLLTDSNITT